MDDNKLVYAKILGEIYRTQKRLNTDACPVGDDVIYGLLNGIESVVNNELSVSSISESEQESVEDILNEYSIDEGKLSGLKGYYDIEQKLNHQGISRSKAIKILTLLQAEGKFTDVIEKFNSAQSPGECKTFNIPNWSK